MENQKKYLTLPKKLAYGSGDFGANFFYMLVSSFVMLYLTDTVGLNAGIVGTLIMVSKLLDGITDVIFGHILDRTKSKMGKARPWMFYSGFPLAISLVLLFMVPVSVGTTAQYVYFFVVYVCGNALFYTANNISYSTMSALITKNDAERVSLGSFRYVFAVVASVLVSSVTVVLVNMFGGGAEGWRNVAVIYAVILLICNSLASLCCKEIEEDTEAEENGEQSKAQVSGEGKSSSFLKELKIVLTNKYYLLLIAIYLLYYTQNNLASSVGVYYFKYIFGNEALLGVVSMSAFVMVLSLIFNPMLVKKFGMYRVNLVTYVITAIMCAGVCVCAYTASFSGIVIFFFLKSIAAAFLLGSLNAIVAEVAENVYLRKKVHVEGMMFSCSSIGIKVGGGLGAGLAGWLLAAAGYVGTAQTQPESVYSMIKFMYGALPLIMTVLMVVCLAFMKVTEENKKLK